MIKIALLLFISIMSHSISAQNIDRLEKLMGFKIFTFGDNKEIYKGKIKNFIGEFYLNDSSIITRWDDHLFHQNVILGFLNNKLYYIEIHFYYDDLQSYEFILDDLELMFGESKDYNTNGDILRMNEWTSKNMEMTLRLSSENYKNKVCSSCKISLEIIDSHIKREYLFNQFKPNNK